MFPIWVSPVHAKWGLKDESHQGDLMSQGENQGPGAIS